jgi:integrase
MAEATLNQVPVLGGAGTIYQRRADGPWYVYFWVKAERKRFRRSLETSDKSLAIRTAEQIVLDALTKQKAGQKVISSTLGDVIDKWLILQSDRIKRGEIRSEEYVRNLACVFRKQLGGCFGLETPISALAQEDWERYLDFRGNQGVALDTLRVEVSHIRGLVAKVGMKLGARLVPEFNLHVPKAKRAKRTETFNSKEFHELLDVLDSYCCPETDDGQYVRDWSLGAAKARRKAPKIVNQDLERSRRELLRWFVLIAASSGCRPHELAGDERGSLRWRDIDFKTVEVMVSFSDPAPTLKTIAMLRVRPLTKTGERSVPMAGGQYLKNLKAWSRFTKPDDFVFCDQYGIRAGKPIYLDSIRLHWREVLQRMDFDRFKPDLYSLRHFFATERLAAGAPPLLVAKSLGHSLTELTATYEHILMEQEGVIRDVWRDNTPKELMSLGVVVTDPDELLSA